MSEPEPDWSQVDPSAEQVKVWMRRHASLYARHLDLAVAAHEHFRRPFHLTVLYRWTEELWDEQGKPL